MVFRDGDDTHSYVIPTGTTIRPEALLLEEAAFGFGWARPTRHACMAGTA